MRGLLGESQANKSAGSMGCKDMSAGNISGYCCKNWVAAL